MADKPLSRAMLRVLRARETIVCNSVFFASLVYNLKLVEADEHEKKVFTTLATNGLVVIFNPDFIEKHDKVVEGLLLHEVCHAAFVHPSRRRDRKPFLWNVACDYSVNPLVKQLYRLPEPHLDDAELSKYTPERIYDILLERQQEQPKGNKGKGGKDSGDEQGDDKWSSPMFDPTPEEAEQAAEQWEQATKLAAKRAEEAGQLHGQLRRVIEEMYPADKINWRDLIQNMAREARAKVNASFARPNRRYIGQGMILPGETTDNVYRLVVCIDSSGSITEDNLRAMKAESMTLLDQQIVTHVTLISTDTKVCNQEDVESSEEVQKFNLGSHGGGTQFDAAMQAVSEVPDAVGCIFLTDMETSSFGKDPGIPVVWVNWNKGLPSVPFGRVVTY